MILKFDFQRDEVSFFFLLSHPTALPCIPRSGEDVAQRQKGESGCERSEQTEGVKPEKAAAPYGVQRLSLEENEELVGMGIT